MKGRGVWEQRCKGEPESERDSTHPQSTLAPWLPCSPAQEKGQTTVLFALVLPVVALFLVGILDYMVTNARLMEVIAAADLAAHAGVQEIAVRPDGTLEGLAQGQAVAELYFRIQAPSEAQFASSVCGRSQGQPACQVWAQMPSAGYLIPQRQIQVSAIGYLARGVTRGDQ